MTHDPKSENRETAVFNVGVGNYIRTGGRNTFGTLAELEDDLRRARAHGAPDDATVIGTSSASIYVAEVQWIGAPSDVN